MPRTLLGATFALGLIASAVANPLHARQTISGDPSALSGKSFDFVVVGGGTAGLAVAARLAENASVTVAVIEAGSDGSDVADKINIPGYSYLNGLTGSSNDWNYTTTVQANAGGQTKTWPRGKVLGGSSAINGMFFGRGNQIEYNGWASLNSLNDSWNWNDVQAHIQKAETFTPPTDEQMSQYSLKFDSSAHGSSGPIHSSLPGFLYNQLDLWIPTLKSMGLPQTSDQSSGDNHGVFLSTSAINPANETRSFSRSGYIDSRDAPNLTILTGYRATKLLWATSSSSNVTASGVEFALDAADNSTTRYTVNAAKEVIVSGGSINTPQLLQLSGIGASSLLNGLGIPTVVDLPGVGQGLQDHGSVSLYFNTNNATTWAQLKNDQDYAAQQLSLYRTDPSASAWSYVNDAVAYPAGSDLYGSSSAVPSVDVDSIISTNQASNPTVDSTVLAGYKAQHELAASWLTQGVGQYEIILTMLGGSAGQIGIQAVSQHPFARGSVLINSNDPWEKPSVNPNYLDNDMDRELFRSAVAFVRKIAATAPMSGLITSEIAPGSSTTSDNDIDQYVGNSMVTGFHPTGTSTMLPLELGGVVDSNLRVHGTSNVRVIDASIFPNHISAHLMQTTYGIAEKGAELIKTTWGPVNTGSDKSSTASGSGTAASPTGKSNAHSSAASSSATSSGSLLVAAIAIGSFVLS